jgi:hypothetical protein
MNFQQEAIDLVRTSIVIAAKQDRENLISLLQKSGFLVNEDSTEDDLIQATLSGIKDNPRFKKMFGEYLANNIKGEQMSANGEDEDSNANEDDNNLSYLDEDFFNFNVGKSLNSLFVNKQGQDTAFGKALRNNADNFVKVGIDAIGVAITNKANKSNNKLAIEMSQSETKRLFQENISKGLINPDGTPVQRPSIVSPTRGSDGAFTPPDADLGKKNKWVLPVVIVGGIIVLGVVTYFLTKKKGVATPIAKP